MKEFVVEYYCVNLSTKKAKGFGASDFQKGEGYAH